MSSKSNTIDHELRELEQEKFILEEIVEHLEQNKTITNEILDSLSHELRTPIVAIKAYTDMLLHNKFGELTPEQKQRLQVIQKNTDLLTNAVFDLLEKKPKN